MHVRNLFHIWLFFNFCSCDWPEARCSTSAGFWPIAWVGNRTKTKCFRNDALKKVLEVRQRCRLMAGEAPSFDAVVSKALFSTAPLMSGTGKENEWHVGVRMFRADTPPNSQSLYISWAVVMRVMTGPVMTFLLLRMVESAHHAMPKFLLNTWVSLMQQLELWLPFDLER